MKNMKITRFILLAYLLGLSACSTSSGNKKPVIVPDMIKNSVIYLSNEKNGK
jgi:hypothetical protein